MYLFFYHVELDSCEVTLMVGQTNPSIRICLSMIDHKKCHDTLGSHGSDEQDLYQIGF